MRVLVRITAALLALALAAVGALLALEVGWQWLRPRDAPLLVPWPSWRDRLAELTWASDPLRVVGWVTAGAGLLLLVAALLAGRREVPLQDPEPGVAVRTSPRSLARIIGTRVRAQDNVTSAAVTATARKVRVRVTSRLEGEAQLRPRITGVVDDLLGELPLVARPRVSVVVDSPRDR